MGCGNSIEFVVNPDVKGQTASLLDTADKLMLYKYQVDKLYAVFKHLDLDGGGEVSISEFCANMEIEPTKFTDLVFKLIDRSGTKNFDFEEFLVFCYYYLTLDMAKLNAFAFDMFDVNSNGHLDRDEVNMMARVLWGSERFNSNQIGK
jgi:Ca2+-binding EF-hand superfamily protein